MLSCKGDPVLDLPCLATWEGLGQNALRYSTCMLCAHQWQIGSLGNSLVYSQLVGCEIAASHDHQQLRDIPEERGHHAPCLHVTAAL